MSDNVAQVMTWATPIATYAPRYIAAAVAVAAAFLLRLLLEPWLGETHAYGAFYPAIFLTAYVLGRPPAYFAVLLAAAGGFWAFLDPRFGWGLAATSLAPLVFFALTAGSGVWLITALTSGLDALTAQQGRSKAIADAHAELFKDLQTRIGHHMRILSGVLMLQDREDGDGEVEALLRRADAQSQMIARAHRVFSDHPEKDVDFVAFAAALARSVCAEAGQPDDQIVVGANGSVRLSFEAATSMGVALVEWLAWVLERTSADGVKVDVDQTGGQVRMWVSLPVECIDILAFVPNAELFRAVAGQQGATVGLGEAPDGRPAIEIWLPLHDEAAPARPAVSEAPTLH